VVGNACFGDADWSLIQSARGLAGRSGADLLSVTFTGMMADSEFVRASPWPDLRFPKIADAVLSLFEERTAC
jgi:hypothetical protein